MAKCLDHLNFINEICPDCKEPVDGYGNTAYQFDNCSFPDCGCDGARLCMASNGASDDANKGNVEGMWKNGRNKKCREAAFYTMSLCAKKKEDTQDEAE